jgi:hypothetical protein
VKGKFRLAKKYSMPFLEVSAKDGTNIDEIFYTLGKGIKQNYDKESPTDNGIGHTQINNLKEGQTKKGCEC